MTTTAIGRIRTTRPGPTAQPTVEPVDRGRPRRGVAARMVSAVCTLLLVAGALSLLLMTLGPRLLHYRTATMLTGSMSPGINPGDIIVDTLEPARDIAVGQIVTYHIPVDDHRVESHRVVWVGHDNDGAILFRTKGDANTAPDPWTARVDGTQIWRVRGVVPVVGSVIRALRTPIVHLLLAVVLPVLLVIWLLIGIWRPKRPAAEGGGAAGIATGAQEPGPSR